MRPDGTWWQLRQFWAILAKYQDLQRFLDFFTQATGTDDMHQWTRSVSEAFVKRLQRVKSERTQRTLSPTTVNRVLATLRTTARWIHAHQPFLAGFPMERINDINTPEPTWQGLTDLQVRRLKSASEQLMQLSTRRNQLPYRDNAILHLLLTTALRVHEMINLDLDQYRGKHLVNVKRKGRNVTPESFLPKRTRLALDQYLDHERGRGAGPLLRTRTGRRLTIQHVDYILKKIAAQANAHLPEKEYIDLHPHLLRHTMLRKVADEKGIRYAMEFAGHVSPNYIRRYTMPSREEKEAVLEELFG
jgi:site-specific recombinase XerD